MNVKTVVSLDLLVGFIDKYFKDDEEAAKALKNFLKKNMEFGFSFKTQNEAREYSLEQLKMKNEIENLKVKILIKGELNS